MSTTSIYLVRHGETEWNVSKVVQGQADSPLTYAARDRALALSPIIGRLAPEVIVCSDSGRAQNTAARLNDVAGADIELDVDLRERHFGIMQGMTFDEFAAKHPEIAEKCKNDPGYAIEGGESPIEFEERCRACVRRIVQRHVGKRILVVTHGGVLSAVFRMVVGLDTASVRRFSIPNLAINLVTVNNDLWRLEIWGWDPLSRASQQFGIDVIQEGETR